MPPLPFEGITLRRLILLTTSLAVAGTGCSTLGFELENYGFYGSIPTPDGKAVRPGTVLERTRVPAAGDTTDLREGELHLDSMKVGGSQVWVMVRSNGGTGTTARLDSIWFDQATLRTLAVSSKVGDETFRQRFDRRAVETERISSGRASRRKVLHSAVPYSLRGIEMVIAALPLQTGAGGSLPVVDVDGGEMRWLRYQVVSATLEPRTVTGGTIFRQLFVVRTDLEGKTAMIWVDPEDRAAVRREEYAPDGTKLLVVRGQGVPKVRMFPVEPLAPPAAGVRILNRAGSGG